MTVKVAISGFGRIGRNVLRAAAEAKRTDLQFVAINDLVPTKDNAHLFKYDSVHGTFPGEVKVSGDSIDVGLGAPIKVLAEKDPSKLPWKDLGIDIVMECTGIFTDKEKAQVHLDCRRQARARLGPLEGRRPHGRLRRQPREADGRPQGRVERLVHDQLPRPRRQGAERPRRHPVGLHDDHPLLHQRPAHPRSGAQGHAPRARRRTVDDPDLDRRRGGRRPRAAGAERQARRHVHPRADAERLRHRPEVHSRPRDDGRRRSTRRCSTRRRSSSRACSTT